MTDEAIILDTLKFIREHTLYDPHPYINIRETIWYNYNRNKQDFIENRLLERTLISLNTENQQEVTLTAQARSYIELGDLKLKRDFIKYLKKQSDIKIFMVDNFIKPDPTSELTTYDHDNGVNFLKELKRTSIIDYEDNDLLHVSNDWYEDPPQNTKKRWFDTLHQPMLVTIVTQRSGGNKIPNQNKINDAQKQSVIRFFSHRSIYWWAALIGIISGAIAIWIYLVSPIVKSILEYFSN